MKTEFDAKLNAYAQQVNAYLETCFTEQLPQKELFDSMRYSLLAGGKRIRPVLVLEFCRVCGGDPEQALPFAAAIEMVHNYSLIHDDLPCMDNDDYRRGRLTNHKVYGEAMALLAGDGLLTAAFETASQAEAPAQVKVNVIRTLAEAAGGYGMVGGQVLDLMHNTTREELERVHSLKTAAMIRAACCMGVYAADGGEAAVAAAAEFAEGLGIAFQVQDDLLDVVGDQAVFGKPIGSDAENDKCTFATLYGVEKCREIVRQQTERAKAAIAGFEDPAFLHWLADKLANREK